jgi:hypothetical protein
MIAAREKGMASRKYTPCSLQQVCTQPNGHVCLFIVKTATYCIMESYTVRQCTAQRVVNHTVNAAEEVPRKSQTHKRPCQRQPVSVSRMARAKQICDCDDRAAGENLFLQQIGSKSVETRS